MTRWMQSHARYNQTPLAFRIVDRNSSRSELASNSYVVLRRFGGAGSESGEAGEPGSNWSDSRNYANLFLQPASERCPGLSCSIVALDQRDRATKGRDSK